MELKEFQSAAIKTESTVEEISVDLKYLSTILEILICAGNLLDQVKKEIFYGKEINSEDRAKYITGIIAAMDTKSLFVDDPTANKETMNVAPRLFHSIIGIATESTELLENLANNESLDIVNVLEEFSDIDWYKAIGYDATGADWESSLVSVIAKLKQRYSDKFNAESAINRDLDTERAILEDLNTHDLKDTSD